MTGSTHAKPPQRTQPKTEARGTRQGQPHRGARNRYDAERAQRPCLGRGQRQAHETGSRPGSTCPAQPPSNAGGDSPQGAGRHHGDGKADRSTKSDRTGRGAAHQRGATRHAREARRRPQPQHEDRCQATTATGCREPGKRAKHTTNSSTGQGAKDSGAGGSRRGATTRGARKKGKKRQSSTHANASEDSKENKKHDAPDCSIQGGMKHGTSPRIGSSGGEPGATDTSVRGNGENRSKRRPGLEHPGRSGARPKPPDWIVRGRTRCHGLEHPGQSREYDKKTPRNGATGAE